jgi:hypothetical protein
MEELLRPSGRCRVAAIDEYFRLEEEREEQQPLIEG